MIIGLDVSTSTIGYSVFNESTKLVVLGFINLTKLKILNEKANFFLGAFKSVLKEHDIKRGDIKHIMIEEPLLAFFKFSNAKTLAKLQAFNGIISYTMSTFTGLEPELINAARARKLVCGKLKKKSIKEEVFNFVKNIETQIQWPLTRVGSYKKQCMDMSDAYVVGKSYFKR